jgi:uncharacterized protein DUF6364
MTTKLTLSIDTRVIDEAKKFSRKKGISISKLVEGYLQQISKPDKGPKKYLIDEMIGVIHDPSITPDNWKQLRNAHRDSKFTK